MDLLRRAFVIAALAACSSHSPPPAAPAVPPAPAAPTFTVAPGDLAITHVHVVAMSTPGEPADQTVVVRGDRIVGFAPSAAVALPDGAQVQVIDGHGGWVMPGLADMHVHTLGDNDRTMFLAAGVTTVRNMFGSELDVRWREQIAAGTMQGPTIFTAGPLIDGDPPYWPGSAVLTDPAAADALVADQKAKGYDFLKPYSRLSLPAYQALVAAGKKYGMALEGHVPDAVGLAGVLAAQQKSIEHLGGYIEALVPDGTQLPTERKAMMQAALAKASPARIPVLVDQTKRAGTWNCPTLVVLDHFAALDHVDALKQRVKWLELVSPALLAAWDPKQDFRLRSFTDEDYARIRAENGWFAKLTAALAAGGAPLLVGTDTGNPFVIPGAALHDELELLVKAGVPRAQVMRAATAGAAEFVGTPHAFGVIEPGARADLLLVAVDPLAQAIPLVPDGVLVRGKWLPRAELEAKLAAIAKAIAAPPADYWQDAAPLAPDGKLVRAATFDAKIGDAKIGEERLAVTGAPGKHTVTSQLVMNLGGRIEIDAQVSRDGMSFAMTSPAGKQQVAGKLAGGKLTVTGSDDKGQPVSLSAPLAKGGLLTGLGALGAVQLADQLADLKVGGKRTLHALSISALPALALHATEFAIERKPDAGGHKVFAVIDTTEKQTSTGELTLDAQGFPLAQVNGPPFPLSFFRHPD